MSVWRHGPKAVIGLIGGIGAGKSTASRLLAARGGAVVDADALGHAVLDQEDVRQSITRLWGERANLLRPDGRIDRRALGRIVFQNSADRNALEALVLPYIRERAAAAVAAAQANRDAEFVVLDAAILLEAGWNEACDRIVYIDAPHELRLARVAARSHWTAADLTAREVAQWPRERKMAASDAVLLNDRDERELEHRLLGLLDSWGVRHA